MVATDGTLSARARGLQPSPTMAMDAAAKRLQAEGRDLINLTAGEPDFPTVRSAAEAAVRAIGEGFTHYTAAAGIAELRAAIADKLRRENGAEYAPDQIAVTPGAKFALYAAMQVLCEPGDEVLVAAPYWVSYPDQAKLAGARPVFIPTRPEDGFRLRAEDVAAALGQRSKVLVLNSPCNPTGAVIPPDEIEAIGDLVLRHPRLIILSDEIYERMIYGSERHRSIAAVSPELWRRTVTVNGFSKAFSMTGWRVGYTAAPPDIARAIANFLSQTTSNVTSVAQRAALGALQGPASEVESMVAEFARRRAYMLDRLQRMPSLRCAAPGGAFYVFPNVARAVGLHTPQGRALPDVDALCMALMEEAGLGTVPGSGFGAPEHLRISYAASLSQLESGCDRLERFLSSLR